MSRKRETQGTEWLDQIREAIKDKVYTDEQVGDIRAILG
jgi:hypothetical protein